MTVPQRAGRGGVCPLCEKFIATNWSHKPVRMAGELPPLTLDGRQAMNGLYYHSDGRPVRLHLRAWAHDYCYPATYLPRIEAYVEAALNYDPGPGGEDVRSVVLPTVYDVLCALRPPTTEEAARYVDFQLSL